MEWIIVTVIVIIAALVACILWAKQLSKHKFQCKACSKPTVIESIIVYLLNLHAFSIILQWKLSVKALVAVSTVTPEKKNQDKHRAFF